MSKPIIYTAFANQQDDHLPLLKKESSEIKDALRVLESREFIKVEREESTELKDLINTFSTYPDQIAIFHYGGHAGHTLIQLEDADAQSAGLAKLLGEQKSLQLVFLNGCSTRGQVQQLFAQGVKAVIATSVPIEDSKSLSFASAFYKALANKRSIKLAFEFAKATVETNFKNPPAIEIFRGLEVLENKEESHDSDMPWGLYINDGKEQVLEWRLPYYREVGLPSGMKSYINKELKLNKYIVLALDEMCKYNKDIYRQMVEVIDGEEVKRDSSTYIDIVIKNFPWVIGSQLRLVLQKKEANRERLEQLISTHIVLSMVLYYLLLTDIWDEFRKRKSIKRPSKLIKDLAQTKDNLLQKDFLAHLGELYQMARSNQFDFYIPEFIRFCDTFLNPESHLAKANAFLVQLKGTFRDLPEKEVANTCVQTEQALAIVLREAAFLADYRMLTVRNISIDNPRYSEKIYEMDMGPLNALVDSSLSLYEDDEKKRKDNYANCNSIILVTSEKDVQQSLNLSPFIIDKNTFLKNDHIDLFVYGYEKDNRYYYLAVKHSIFIALKDEKGTDIIDTEMTLSDFEEGRNITRKNEELNDDAGFLGAFQLDDTEVATESSPKVFTLLEKQFEQFKTDLS
ncbi:MAG: CHAT domain-containing protein [Saprospiraceae bacterium]|nr:CHAT domain-containing protein [Saprospiraceae bacterium]